MRRREFIITILSGAAGAYPLASSAQLRATVQKVGFLYPGPASAVKVRLDTFIEGLRNAGYRVPEQLEVIPVFADGDPARLGQLAVELVGRNVDVIAAVSTAAANGARAATSTVPIVGLDLETDPVATGMIASLARPGGNLTGFFFDFAEFRGKLLELLKEIVPGLFRIAVIWDPNSGPAQLKSVEAGADAMKLKLLKFETRNTPEMVEMFEAAKRAAVDAVVILSSPFIGANVGMIAGLTLKHGLPAATLFSEFARSGGLISYGPNILDIYRRVGGMVARVLNGSKPSELPVELPTRFELLINIKTARALNLEIPANLLVRADEVIE